MIVILAKLRTRDVKSCDLSQKIEPISKDNDFEVLELRLEINIHVPQIFQCNTWNSWQDQNTSDTMFFFFLKYCDRFKLVFDVSKIE